MTKGIQLKEISYIEDFTSGSGGQCELIISSTDDAEIIIHSLDTYDDSQHDYSINKEDWELIKRMVDNHFKNKKEG